MTSTVAKISIAIISVAAIFCSCNSEIGHVRQRMATANTRYVRQYNIIEMPQIADLNVEDRLVSGSFSGNDVSAEDAKSLAVANAIKTASADVLVEPIYDVTIDDNTVNASVRGHPAHYKNFRKPPINEKLYGNVAHQSRKTQAGKEEKEEEPSYWGNEQEDHKATVEDDKPAETKTERTIVKEEKEEEVPPAEKTVADKPETQTQEEDGGDGKLKTPCFIISCSAVSSEWDARSQAESLSRKGFQAGYLWIPDYDASGKKLFKVYVGSFRTRTEAESALPRVKTVISSAYVQLLK